VGVLSKPPELGNGKRVLFWLVSFLFQFATLLFKLIINVSSLKHLLLFPGNVQSCLPTLTSLSSIALAKLMAAYDGESNLSLITTKYIEITRKTEYILLFAFKYYLANSYNHKPLFVTGFFLPVSFVFAHHRSSLPLPVFLCNLLENSTRTVWFHVKYLTGRL
jgi:hypothetical protein